MRIFCLIVFLFAFWNADLSAHVNPYAETSNYENVYVRSGDTVWQIAAKYTDDSQDIRDLVMAIVKINKLNNNAQVYPGQTLKVPQVPQKVLKSAAAK